MSDECENIRRDKIRISCIVYDGCTHDSEHYFAVFTTYTYTDNLGA